MLRLRRKAVVFLWIVLSVGFNNERRGSSRPFLDIQQARLKADGS
jgi:hypothetical protein